MKRPALWLLVAATSMAPVTPVTPAAPRRAPELSEQDREAAIAAIHRRLEHTPPDAPETRRLAAELEGIGRAYLDGGDSGRAIELLGEAYALDETSAAALAGLTLAYARAEDLDAAAFYLRLAQERGDREAPEAYASLGEIFSGAHRLDDAVAAWGEAVRRGGQDPLLVRRLARARDEVATARGQRSLSTEHFAIFAEPSISDALLRRAADELEAAHASQAAFFGIPLASRQVVVLYGGRAFFALASVPDWVSGVYDGKIRVALRSNAEEPGALEAVLAHELGHALLRQMTGDGAPAWLHEGLAQWLEGRRLSREQLGAEARRRGAHSIEDLERRFRGAMDREEARASYADSLSLIEYLVAVRGEGAVACLVTRLREGATFDEALRGETGLAPRELSAGWRTWAASP